MSRNDVRILLVGDGMNIILIIIDNKIFFLINFITFNNMFIIYTI